MDRRDRENGRAAITQALNHRSRICLPIEGMQQLESKYQKRIERMFIYCRSLELRLGNRSIEGSGEEVR